MINKILVVILLTCLGGHLLYAADPEVLTDSSVVELKKLGLGDEVVIQKIKTSSCKFDLGLDGLRMLKSANISDEVIKAMLTVSSVTQVPAKDTAVVAAPAQVDLDDCKAPHPAGIWMYETKDGKSKMKLLEPSVYSQAKHGIALFAQYGQRSKSEAVLRSAHAVLKTENRRPVFYFYFERSQAGLGISGGITSANEFILAQFTCDEDKNQRRLVVGEFGAYTGSEVGPEDKAVRSFDFEKIADGIYKVTVKEDLASGEYGFFYAGGAAGGAFAAASHGGRIFDFSVHGSPETEPAAPVTKKTKSVKK